MLLDRSHGRWMLVTLGLAILATLLYAWSAKVGDDGPRGGSTCGLWLGISGSVLMLFCGLFTLRKKTPWARWGSARAWMRAHLWLGLLSVVLVLLHSSFRWGGTLEQLLWAVLAAIVASGLFGLVVQQYLPAAMKLAVDREAMYDQLPHVCRQLRSRADQLIEAACGPLISPPPEGVPASRLEPALLVKQFYLASIRPQLTAESAPSPGAATGLAGLDPYRPSLTPALLTALDQLGEVCEERRQLALQARLHGWLHGWLLFHIALSVSLLVLGVAHALMSLYY